MNYNLNVRPKFILYLSLIVLSVMSFIYWTYTDHSSLSENLLASAIEILITVFIIDGLLTINRKHRLDVLNALHANSMTYSIGLDIVKTIKVFGYKIEPNELSVVGMTNLELTKFVDEFYNSQIYNKFLEDLRKANTAVEPKLLELKKELNDSFASINKGLKPVRPYPDPKITLALNDIHPNIIASFEIIKFMYEAVHELLPGLEKKSDGSPDSSKQINLIKNLFNEELVRLVKEDDGSDDRANFNKSFKGCIDVFLMVHLYAEKNKLHFDV